MRIWWVSVTPPTNTQSNKHDTGGWNMATSFSYPSNKHSLKWYYSSQMLQSSCFSYPFFKRSLHLPAFSSPWATAWGSRTINPEPARPEHLLTLKTRTHTVFATPPTNAHSNLKIMRPWKQFKSFQLPLQQTRTQTILHREIPSQKSFSYPLFKRSL